MSDISSIGHAYGNPVGPTNRVGATGAPSDHPASQTAPSGEAGRTSDRLELSEHARLLDQLRQMPDIRTERVEAIREAIAQGGYENAQRLETAIEKLLKDLWD